MAKKKKKAAVRAEPTKRSAWYCDIKTYESLKCSGYISLADNPEISTAVDRIASLIGSMTIHLMENRDDGDVRIKNELSKIVDVNPNNYMNRSNFIHWVVKTMLLTGNGNAVVYPVTENGYLRQLIPIPALYTSFIPKGFWGYEILINGEPFDPKSLLHFVTNPGDLYTFIGTGYKIALSDVANNLKQASATEKAFMESKWKPSLIVKVDGLVEEFSKKEGRENFIEEYLSTSQNGAPWIIPAEQFSVEQVKPLTLSDLALADFVQLDKRAVASILGVPPFVLGIGEFKRDEWNNFISSKIMPLAQIIQQELTRKLIYGKQWFFKFNPRSLYNYDLKDLAAIADDQFVRGLMTGNEVRDWIGLSPLDGLSELVILENYIPLNKIGDQKKLTQ